MRVQRLEHDVSIAVVFREFSHGWPTSSATPLALLALDFVIWSKIIKCKLSETVVAHFKGWIPFLSPKQQYQSTEGWRKCQLLQPISQYNKKFGLY